MRFHEFEKQKGLSLASRTIRNYARELGADSMDYGMLMKSADLLDKDMLKSLAQHIDKSDTSPREYVMKKIADHNPEIFKKMYGVSLKKLAHIEASVVIADSRVPLECLQSLSIKFL